jgi:hypothetical protein
LISKNVLIFFNSHNFGSVCGAAGVGCCEGKPHKPCIAGMSSRSTSILLLIIQFNSVLYFNVLTQQQQKPITESAQENNKCTKNMPMHNLLLAK